MPLIAGHQDQGSVEGRRDKSMQQIVSRDAATPKPIGDLADAIRRLAGDDHGRLSHEDRTKSLFAVAEPEGAFRP
jgi:hypothetical protein